MVLFLDSKRSISQEDEILSSYGVIFPRLGGTHVDLSSKRLRQLNVAAVVVGSLSLVATLTAVGFFIQMRRSFRHEYVHHPILASQLLNTLTLT